MKFEYRLTWKDPMGRPWASEMLTASEPTEARRMHRSSMSGHWVREGMVQPIVTDLYVSEGGRMVTVQEGGEVKAVKPLRRDDR